MSQVATSQGTSNGVEDDGGFGTMKGHSAYQKGKSVEGNPGGDTQSHINRLSDSVVENYNRLFWMNNEHSEAFRI